jgi:hypothetical protein
MNRICWWLIHRLSRALESHERDAVLGDFAESGVSGGQALCDLLGLVGRRQAALWKEYRPWLALLGLVAPLGILLSLASRWWAEGGAIYSCIYIDNWTWGYLESPGARRDLADTAAHFSTDYLALVGWSWTIGFVLGSISRRTIWVNGVLFYLALFAGTLGSTTSAHNPMNDGIFSLAFYSVVFPLALRTVLVVVPSLCGMHKGIRLAALPLPKTLLWALPILVLTLLAHRSLEAAVIFSRWQREGPLNLSLASLRYAQWLLPLAVMWPVGYMVAVASWQPWRRKSVST